jgi:hypothetical protein
MWRVTGNCAFSFVAFVLNNEVSHDDIWTEYQYYGIGQYKLIVERYKESGNELLNSHVMYDYMDLLVTEYKSKEFIDMDTSYFDKKNVREKAISVDEKELYGLYYNYESQAGHLPVRVRRSFPSGTDTPTPRADENLCACRATRTSKRL